MTKSDNYSVATDVNYKNEVSKDGLIISLLNDEFRLIGCESRVIYQNQIEPDSHTNSSTKALEVSLVNDGTQLLLKIHNLMDYAIRLARKINCNQPATFQFSEITAGDIPGYLSFRVEGAQNGSISLSRTKEELVVVNTGDSPLTIIISIQPRTSFVMMPQDVLWSPCQDVTILKYKEQIPLQHSS